MRPTPIEPRTRLTFRSADARNVLFVRAVESEDPRGRILGIDVRRRIGREVFERIKAKRPARRLAARAAALSEHLAKVRPELWHRYRARELPAHRLWAVLLLAFVAGLAGNALGPDRAINVLAPPLVGLLAWNLAVYLFTLIRFLVPTRKETPASASTSSTWWQRASPLVRGLERSAERGTEEDDAELDRRIARRFLEDWLPIARPVAVAAVAAALHLAAAAAVLGVVVGMYARGLALEYRATWESTFLGPSVVDAFLGTVLSPASGLLGLDLPAASLIQAPSSGSAAPWIHAWAATAVMVVGVPRLLLALAAAWKIRRLRRRTVIELPDSYLRRLIAAVDTREEKVQVLPYSYRPTEKTLTALRTLLLDLRGARASVHVASSLDYGDPLPEADGAGFRVALFSAGQTPELEVHGEWLEGMVKDRVDGQSLLVIVDESPFKKRLADDSGSRLESRRRAWRRALDHAGLPGVFLELDAEDLDRGLEAAAAGVWPGDEKGRGR